MVGVTLEDDPQEGYRVVTLNHGSRNVFEEALIIDPKNYIRDRGRSDYLWEYIHETLCCKKMVIEWEYIDSDYLADYSQYFSMCYHPYESVCRRLHFFTDLDDATFHRIVNDGESIEYLDDMNRNYRGNIVVRPLPMAVIGRTFLQCRNLDEQLNEERQSSVVIKCFEEQSFNLFGIDLSTRGMFFQEQDQCTGACATSAVWSALQNTAGRFNHARPSRFQVTSLATRNLQAGRAFPSPGLDPGEMCEAIRGIGLEPEYAQYLISYSRKKKGIEYRIRDLPLLGLCYAFLRGGFPVIMPIYIVEMDELHAITLSGYKLGKKPREHTDPGRTRMFALRGSNISEFYVHDDVFGPYIPTRVSRRRDQELLYLNTRWKRKGRPCTAIPSAVIIPVPPLIRVQFETILNNIQDMTDWIVNHTITGGRAMEWDVFLTSVNDYKRELLRRYRGNREKNIVLLRNSPKFFWRCRASVAGEPMFEILADATDMEPSCQFFQAVFHREDIKSYLIESLKDKDGVSNLVTRYNLRRFFISDIFKETLERGPVLG